VRFNHGAFPYGAFTFADAIRHTITLFDAARAAGVERIVHVSITNPSEGSRLEYFRGKAVLERVLKASDVSYAILRPTVLFGKEDILVNNIAWALRRFPVFAVFGNGRYRLRPIHVDDLAALAVAQGDRRENAIIDAVGPETFTYRGLVKAIGEIIGARRPIVSVPPMIGYMAGRLVGLLMNDVLLTRDEIEGLMAGLLDVDSPSAGTTRLTDWAREHAASLGKHYASELARRKNRVREYGAR
jgi:NADH dehydrogenase